MQTTFQLVLCAFQELYRRDLSAFNCIWIINADSPIIILNEKSKSGKLIHSTQIRLLLRAPFRTLHCIKSKFFIQQQMKSASSLTVYQNQLSAVQSNISQTKIFSQMIVDFTFYNYYILISFRVRDPGSQDPASFQLCLRLAKNSF